MNAFTKFLLDTVSCEIEVKTHGICPVKYVLFMAMNAITYFRCIYETDAISQLALEWESHHGPVTLAKLLNWSECLPPAAVSEIVRAATLKEEEVKLIEKTRIQTFNLEWN